VLVQEGAEEGGATLLLTYDDEVRQALVLYHQHYQYNEGGGEGEREGIAKRGKQPWDDKGRFPMFIYLHLIMHGGHHGLSIHLVGGGTDTGRDVFTFVVLPDTE